MEKKDLLVLVIALLVVLGIALVAKPLLGNWIPAILPEEEGLNPSPTIMTIPISPQSTPSPEIHWEQFAVLNGNRSGTTEEFEVPFSSWEIWYSANLSNAMDQENSTIFPKIRIQVVDAEDPSRIVSSLEPDLLDARIGTPYDPRPWKERIGEGNHRYYFVIHIQSISSYTVEILVPTSAA